MRSARDRAPIDAVTGCRQQGSTVKSRAVKNRVSSRRRLARRGSRRLIDMFLDAARRLHDASLVRPKAAGMPVLTTRRSYCA